MHAYSVANNHAAIDFLFEEMRSFSHSPSIATYNALLAGYMANKDWDKCWQFFDKLRKENLADPDDITLKLMIQVCGQSNKPESIEPLMRELEKEFNVKISKHIHMLASQSYLNCKWFAEAAHQLLLAKSVSWWRPTCRAVVMALLENNKLPEQFAYMKRMVLPWNKPQFVDLPLNSSQQDEFKSLLNYMENELKREHPSEVQNQPN